MEILKIEKKVHGRVRKQMEQGSKRILSKRTTQGYPKGIRESVMSLKQTSMN